MPKRKPPCTSRKWFTGKEARELHDHYHALGVLQARWNISELQIQRICWFLMAAGPEVGRGVTNEMGNIARTNLMITLAREVIQDAQLLKYFERVEKLFNRNREDRNFLSHCRIMYVTNLPSGSKCAAFQSFKADRRFRHKMYFVPLEELRQVADDVQIMNTFFANFFDYLERINSGSPLKLPDIPSPPHSLLNRLSAWDPIDSSSRKSSREK